MKLVSAFVPWHIRGLFHSAIIPLWSNSAAGFPGIEQMSYPNRRGLRGFLLLMFLALPVWGQSKPLSPAEAPKHMTLPEGFHVTLFAAEPDVVQPIAFTFDDRGRLWVVECRSYPKWRDDRTGHDRVVIFEDTDGDGVFDKRTVFWDKGSNLSGIEVGFGGVWLCSTPDLIFIPVENDKPAGPPQVILDGLDLTAKHNVFNSLT